MANLKKKTVTRTYYSKKAGGYVTKVYEYDAATYRRGTGAYARKGYNLITKSKSGQLSIRKKNVEKFKKEILKDPNLTPQLQQFLADDLDSYIAQRAKEGKTLTSTGYLGVISSTSIDRFFANMGRTAEEAAFELGVNINDLTNDSNWQWSDTGGEGIYTDPIAGVQFIIDFTYEGSLAFTRR